MPEIEKEKIPPEIGKEKILEKEKFELERKIDQKVKEELRKIEKIPELSFEVKKEKKKIEKLNLSGKIERLFEIAGKKGLFYAIALAKSTGDGYLIDVFHDILAYRGFYKKFLKKRKIR